MIRLHGTILDDALMTELGLFASHFNKARRQALLSHFAAKVKPVPDPNKSSAAGFTSHFVAKVTPDTDLQFMRP